MGAPGASSPQHARVLLDTHVWLWWQRDDRRLARPARQAIADADEAWVSGASAWEMAIKVALGRLQVPGDIGEAIRAGGFLELPISFRHVAALHSRPAKHRDPFDRMLVAQASVEGLTLVTADRAIASLHRPCLWAGR